MRRWPKATLIATLAALIVLTAPAGADAAHPAPEIAPAPAMAVALGTSHACAIGVSGVVKCWGLNSHGQLGLGDTTNRGDSDGEMGGNLPAVDLGTGRSATSVAVGDLHTCAVLDDGHVKCWGRNDNGQLGVGDTASRGDGGGEMGNNLPAVDLGTGRTATAVSAGHGFSCALLDNGQVKCWGYNGESALGVGNTSNRGDGPGEMGENLPAVDLGTGRTAVAITGISRDTCALLDNGQVKCWGFNGFGELGLGDVNNRGDTPAEMGDNLPALDFGTGRTATAISTGWGHSCAILDDGSLKCWGFNADGRLGLGDTNHRGDAPGEMGDSLPAVDLGAGRTATSVTAGDGHICVILDNGDLKCWGHNDEGQLGLGDTTLRGTSAAQMGDNLPAVDLGSGLSATSVTAGRSTCAVIDDTRLKCWGSNTSGTLGLGDTAHRGDAADEMGDDLPFVSLVVNPRLTVTAGVDATTHFTGDQISFGFDLDNPGELPLTGVQLTGVTGFSCSALATNLPVGGSSHVDCSRTLTAADVGTLTTSFGATSDQVAAEPANVLEVDVDRNRAPDGELKKVGGAYVGDGIRNGDATNQLVGVTRTRGGHVTFLARVTNAGDTAHRFRIQPTTSSTGLAVRYFERTTGVDITRVVEQGTYRTARLGPGQRATVRVEITVKPQAALATDHEVVLQSSSTADVPQIDAVRARVHVN